MAKPTARASGVNRARAAPSINSDGTKTARMQSIARSRGTAVLSTPRGVLSVSGEQVVDIRDFAIASPTVLMLRIYPDVTVRLQIEAMWDGEEVSP